MIYHLIRPKEWEKVLKASTFQYKPPSLKAEGFIHCSSKDQLAGTAKAYFEDTDELIVLGIVEKRIKEKLKWESSRNDELFPHIYGPLPLEAIETTDLVFRDKEGEWEIDNR